MKRFKAEIEKRDFEIQALRLEVESLKAQLTEVKSRNKKLCDVSSKEFPIDDLHEGAYFITLITSFSFFYVFWFKKF